MLRPFLVRGRGRRSLRAVARCSCPKMKCYMPSMPLSCGVRTAGDITGPKLVMLVRLGETNEWYIGIVHIMYYMDMYFELWKKHGVHIDIIWHYIALCDGTVYFFRIFSWVTISDPNSTQHHEEYVYYQRPNIGCLPGKPACWVVEYDFCPWTAQHDDWSKFDNILRIGNILGLSGDLYSNGDVFMGRWPIPKYVLYVFFWTKTNDEELEQFTWKRTL
jgi:hypothetical protein